MNLYEQIDRMKKLFDAKHGIIKPLTLFESTTAATPTTTTTTTSTKYKSTTSPVKIIDDGDPSIGIESQVKYNTNQKKLFFNVTKVYYDDITKKNESVIFDCNTKKFTNYNGNYLTVQKFRNLGQGILNKSIELCNKQSSIK